MVGANADVVDDVHIDIIAAITTRRYGGIASMANECDNFTTLSFQVKGGGEEEDTSTRKCSIFWLL